MQSLCRKNGYEIVETYIDRAKTAKNDKRPEFQHMIAESCLGNFDVVLVWKFDRFTRNRYDSAIYKKHLNNNGVDVVSATEPISAQVGQVKCIGIISAPAQRRKLAKQKRLKKTV